MGLIIRVPRAPAAGESLLGSGFNLGPGGKGLNLAIALAQGKSVEEGVELAVYAGAYCAGKLGVIDVLPTARQRAFRRGCGAMSAERRGWGHRLLRSFPAIDRASGVGQIINRF